MYDPTHIDLFSGIGGFALAAEKVWPNIKHTFCEIDPFCQKVIKKHWPEAEIYGDIRTLTNTGSEEPRRVSGSPRKKIPSPRSVYLLTGGFPCQPFSQAGRRKGTEDDRFLWDEMFRVIKEFRPRWVVGENVAGLLTMAKYDSGFEVEAEEYSSSDDAGVALAKIREKGQARRSGQGILEIIVENLESIGYSVQPFIIPAVAVNAPHRRDRIWIVAYHRRSENASNSASERQQGPRNDGQPSDQKKDRDRETNRPHDDYNWGTDWTEVAARLCRVDDGIPRRVDRTLRLKALGNAIVPQVAIQIFKAIKAYEELST